ncbi:MAG: hypothetical protein E3J90_00290 [Promethearchaeota archaeon]|nr:MAG: hypothetical protein E3J90_00290 [Candidatus Lokiarchaeota archaeon]
MKKTRIVNRIGAMSIVLFMFLILFLKVDFITANGTGPSLTFNTNIEMNEYSKFNETHQNVNSLNITLPSSSWFIQDIELNFTDIKFGKELKIIEGQNYTGDYDRVYYQNLISRNYGLGIQLKLTEPTTIFGVDLYGVKEEKGPTIIDFQIRGYDALNNKPNGSVYSTVEINMSTTEGWHRQNFSSPILLSEGNYFLVINGSNVLTVNDDRIWWYYNNINPSDASLYTSYYNETFQWSTGVQNHTYLHKLIQKVETPVYPEEINMTANINNQLYQISNTTSEEEGYLGKTVVDFSPGSESYQIIVNNQASESLLFNVSCCVTLSNNHYFPSSIVVQEGTTNKWSVKPTIVRQPTNYSVLFNYPSSWENITVLRDEGDITSGVIVDTTDHKIVILNDSISIGADWEIVADSTNIAFDLNVQKTEYTLGQEIEFLLPLSSSPGTYIFILLDPAGIPQPNQTITFPSATPFSYSLSLSDLVGIYTAYVFWFSDTEIDAGVQSQIFEVSIAEPTPTPTPEFPLPLIILISVLGAVVLGLVSFIAYKRIHSRQRTKLEKFLSRFTDLSKINEIIVIDTKSGIDVFSQSFGGRKIDTSLISGFLQAISNFGSTISETAKESRTLNIEYKDSIVMQTEFVNLKLIVTLKENPSANFKFIMEDLAYDIYNQYGKEIDNFAGILKPFHKMKELIEKHLNVSFLYQLKIVENPKIKLSMSEKEMVGKARTFMKENNFNYFYSLYLIPENTSSPKDYQTIFNLIEKGIFQPIKE